MKKKESKKGSYLNISLSIIFLIVLFFLYLGTAYYYSLRSVNVIYGKSSFKYINSILVINGYMFDTGSTLSAKKHKTSSSGYLLTVIKQDFNKTLCLGNVYCERESLVFGSMIFEDVCYFVLRNPSLTQKYEGIIGYPVIKKANWKVDFRDRTIESFPLEHNYSDRDAKMSIKFKYGFIPQMYCSLNINNHEFKNVVIDTGFSKFLHLNENDIEKIGKDDVLSTQGVTADGALSSSETVAHRYKVIDINSVEFKDKWVVLSNGKRRLGVEFFSSFDQIYIDNNKNMIHCF